MTDAKEWQSRSVTNSTAFTLTYTKKRLTNLCFKRDIRIQSVSRQERRREDDLLRWRKVMERGEGRRLRVAGDVGLRVMTTPAMDIGLILKPWR